MKGSQLRWEGYTGTRDIIPTTGKAPAACSPFPKTEPRPVSRFGLRNYPDRAKAGQFLITAHLYTKCFPSRYLSNLILSVIFSPLVLSRNPNLLPRKSNPQREIPKKWAPRWQRPKTVPLSWKKKSSLHTPFNLLQERKMWGEWAGRYMQIICKPALSS